MQSIGKEFTDAHARLYQDFAAGNTVHAVSPYVESIVYNLISNAIKYRSASRDLIIHVSTRVEDNYLCLVVRDNGQGIDLNKHGDNIFNLYKRFHFNVEGKGLGLYLVKSQVNSNGRKSRTGEHATCRQLIFRLLQAPGRSRFSLNTSCKRLANCAQAKNKPIPCTAFLQ
ncbi:MAG: sensor histidine kinase [Bacteroidia bacterium]|nr:sensor histidine kinase [Bacteroidia bacterium]